MRGCAGWQAWSTGMVSSCNSNLVNRTGKVVVAPLCRSAPRNSLIQAPKIHGRLVYGRLLAWTAGRERVS